MNRYLLALTLLVACGGDDDAASDDVTDVQPDDQPEPDDRPEPDPHPCELVPDDLSPGAETPLDGVYTPQLSISDHVETSCGVSDDDTAYKSYLALDRGVVSRYSRVFADGFACVAAEFDSGGTVTGLETTTWRTCGPEVAIDGGVVQQAVSLYRTEDGEIFRTYFYFGRGEHGDTWDELLVSSRSQNHPIEEPPAELDFNRFRKPR